jgi:hypothetical protein
MRHVQHEAQKLFNKWANQWQKRFQEDMEAQEEEWKFREKVVTNRKML